MYRKTYVEINTSQIQKNVTNLIETYGGYDWYIGVVKGNAYGHGMKVAKYMEMAGINYFAVMSLEEAIELRKYVVAPILCLEPIDIEDLNVCIENNVAITLHSYEYYLKLMKHIPNGKLKVHIKLDTGMNRLGIKDLDQFVEIYNKLIKEKNIEVEGLYTHMGTTGLLDKYWDMQEQKFQKFLSLVDISKVKIIHAARSTTVINHEKIPNTNGVRLGIALYGEVSKARNNGLKDLLRNIKINIIKKINNISYTSEGCMANVGSAFKLKSNVIQTKMVKAKECIGYGTKYVAKEDMMVATIPIGYADGINLKCIGGNVEINNKLYKIVSSIGMGMIIVQVDESVSEGDEVTIIGGKISVSSIAMHAESTKYAILTQISNLVPRVYVNEEGEIVG